jgi:hypothetical protein
MKTWRAKFDECSSEESLLRESEAYLRQEKENFALEVSAVRASNKFSYQDLPCSLHVC